ncbi:hypothetical protein C8R43DRAFT_1118967 [Mycena crocata]|nr:hypothetical protein C8R43DRAFT_955772 [Mycena crocata]KAJ7176436.1 hypothetical protein C8R43DRAFT_1118967 [Mycena crocata]
MQQNIRPRLIDSHYQTLSEGRPLPILPPLLGQNTVQAPYGPMQEAEQLILVKAMVHARFRAAGNLEALDELDGIWGLPSCVWKDRYLEHKGTLDGIVRIVSLIVPEINNGPPALQSLRIAKIPPFKAQSLLHREKIVIAPFAPPPSPVVTGQSSSEMHNTNSQSSSGGFPETPTAKKPRIYNVEAPSSPAEIPIAKIPTAKKPRIYNVEAPSSPAEIPITKIPTAKKPRIYDVKVPSFRAGIQNGMQAPSKVASRGRRTHNSLTAHTAVYSDKHPQPHSEIVIPDPPSEAPIPPTDIQAPHHNASSWSGHWHRVHNLADKILARARSEMESDQEDSEDSDSDAEAMDSEDSEDTDDGLNPGQAKRKRIPEEDAQTGGGKRSKLSPTMQAPTSAAKMIMSRHVGF